MTSKVAFQQGNVFSSKGGRPSLVATPKHVSEKTKSVILIPISNASPSEKNTIYSYILPREATQLKKTSVANINQLFTASLSAFKNTSSRKLTDDTLWEKINERLEVAFSFKFPKHKNDTYSQGRVVRINQGVAKGLLGVIVSNNIGNRRSRIVMMSSILEDSEDLYTVPVNLKSILSDSTNLYVKCGGVDTISQDSIEDIEELPMEKMELIYTKVKEAVGLQSH